jgi:predicted pyridoxine 5'-phosphate oxidase superfamily flavin-nucleotide-binding protein
MLLEDHHLIEQKKVSNLIEEGTKADLVESDRLPGSDGDHRLQEKYGKTTHARAFYQHQVLNHLNSAMRAFLARQEMMFVATSDAKGEADSSFRAGHPGSVKVLDERTVVYPEYRGNSVMASLGNISENPHVALLFVDFADQIGLHINGRAQILENDEFLKFLKDHPAQETVLGDAVRKDIIESDGGHLERCVMISIVEAYVQCSKHIPPMQRMDHIPSGLDTGHHAHVGDYFATAHGQK